MSRIVLSRRALLAAGVAMPLVACSEGASTSGASLSPSELVFSILSAEGQASAGPLWQPLLDDMAAAVGIPVQPFFGSNYTILVQAMASGQTHVAWFSAKPAIEAIDRAQGEVVARIVDPEGRDSYQSTLIVKAGSGITLEDVMACGKQYDFGIGDAQSTSGTLAPMAFLFNPSGLVPNDCFRTVRSANHQANAFGVASGVLDVATSNTVNTIFLKRQNPQIAAQIEDIWTSPPIPESGIVVREDLEPTLKEKVRAFFLGYGQGTGAEAERQKAVLAGLNYSAFRAADNSYLDPVREMVADQKVQEARAKGDEAAATAAEAERDALRAKRETQP